MKHKFLTISSLWAGVLLFVIAVASAPAAPLPNFTLPDVNTSNLPSSAAKASPRFATPSVSLNDYRQRVLVVYFGQEW